jgi:hypothetical protein
MTFRVSVDRKISSISINLLETDDRWTFYVNCCYVASADTGPNCCYVASKDNGPNLISLTVFPRRTVWLLELKKWPKRTLQIHRYF